MFAKLTYSSLKNRIADEIRDAIVNGTLGGGERIVEKRMAEQFSTSLTAIREALIELEAQGYVTKRPNRATHVIEFSSSSVDQIFAFRRIVETAVVEQSACVATSFQFDLLKAASAVLMESAQAGDPRSYLQKDLALHELLWKMADNEYLEIALRRVVRPFFAFTVIHVSVPNVLDLVQDALLHLEFVNPIIAREPQLARSAYLKALESWHASARPPYFNVPNSQG